MKTKTIILGLAAVAIAAVGVYGLTQTFGLDEASVAVSKPANQKGLSSKARKSDEDTVRPVKADSRGASAPGMGF